jgi:hypothetical protein
LVFPRNEIRTKKNAIANSGSSSNRTSCPI